MSWRLTVFTLNAISSLVIVAYCIAPKMFLYWWDFSIGSALDAESVELLSIGVIDPLALIILDCSNRFEIYFDCDKNKPPGVTSMLRKKSSRSGSMNQSTSYPLLPITIRCHFTWTRMNKQLLAIIFMNKDLSTWEDWKPRCNNEVFLSSSKQVLRGLFLSIYNQWSLLTNFSVLVVSNPYSWLI